MMARIKLRNLRVRIPRVTASLLLAVLSLVPSSQLAIASTTTYTACDSVPKYWCYSVNYDTYTGGATINARYFQGGLGGSANWWKRWVTQDWRDNLGSWTFMGSWASSGPHYVWESDTIFYARSIDNEAVARMQNQFQDSSDGHLWCDGYVDWHLSDGGYYYMQGSFGCLTP
jgi:hypothetical protein